ncbi:MAG: thiamine phosphate synthase [Alphaproteobacteria bacterium]|nr:thiamine phosphate synthase [Alphaproteobacteria bacterium]
MPRPPLLVISDRKVARRPLAEIAEACFAGGCRWLSLREKDLPHDERVALLRALVALGDKYGARVTVHEDVAAAKAAGAGGVHLPAGGSPAAARQVLGAAALIGLSAHDYADIVHAETEGADYVTLSPIFATASKPSYGPALGVDELADLAAKSLIPVVALGGVDAAAVGSCLAAGAAGVAVMGAVMTAADPRAVTSALVAGLGLA